MMCCYKKSLTGLLVSTRLEYKYYRDPPSVCEVAGWVLQCYINPPPLFIPVRRTVRHLACVTVHTLFEVFKIKDFILDNVHQIFNISCHNGDGYLNWSGVALVALWAWWRQNELSVLSITASPLRHPAPPPIRSVQLVHLLSGCHGCDLIAPFSDGTSGRAAVTQTFFVSYLFNLVSFWNGA